MPLYTVILDFLGGTYISQINAESPELASVKWAENLEVSEIYGLGEKSRKVLVEKLKNGVPVPLDGLQNAWCISALIRSKVALINIIQTEAHKF